MPNITDQIRGVPIALNLTPYGISQMIAAETDPTTPERKRIEKRWQRWTQGDGLGTLKNLEADLNALGYRITIERE
jgi:hypothetical protein